MLNNQGFRMFRRVALFSLALFSVTLFSSNAALLAADATAVATNGGRVFICGHSFHIFNARYLGPIAQAAKLADHRTVDSQMIGGSSVTQHWELSDNQNKVKAALKERKVDVLTMSPN